MVHYAEYREIIDIFAMYSGNRVQDIWKYLLNAVWITTSEQNEQKKHSYWELALLVQTFSYRSVACGEPRQRMTRVCAFFLWLSVDRNKLFNV